MLALGRAAARVLDGDRYLIGRDTRLSGPLLQAALTAGLTSEGAGVADLGVVPTPAVAALSAERNLPAAMISASHNPFPDNGVKFFAAGGRKLSDAVEERLEHELAVILRSEPDGPSPAGRPQGNSVGRVTTDPDAVERYTQRLLTALEGESLDGMRLVLDCANGAASHIAPDVFVSAGADVEVLHAAPDGVNINDGCGSTQPHGLQRAVDEAPVAVDGDHLIALCAVDLRRRGRLRDDTVVVTVMTNLGFRLAMAEHGINVVETQVGDRYVLEALDDGGWSLGGEQSGHVIFRDLATTGDGLLTGLMSLEAVRRTGRPLAEVAGAVMTRLPQVLRNVRVRSRDGLAAAEELWAEVARVEAELGEHGRVVLRPSGTEPLVRVMVEAPTQAEADAASDRLAKVVRATLT